MNVNQLKIGLAAAFAASGAIAQAQPPNPLPPRWEFIETAPDTTVSIPYVTTLPGFTAKTGTSSGFEQVPTTTTLPQVGWGWIPGMLAETAPASVLTRTYSYNGGTLSGSAPPPPLDGGPGPIAIPSGSVDVGLYVTTTSTVSTQSHIEANPISGRSGIAVSYPIKPTDSKAVNGNTGNTHTTTFPAGQTLAFMGLEQSIISGWNVNGIATITRPTFTITTSAVTCTTQ